MNYHNPGHEKPSIGVTVTTEDGHHLGDVSDVLGDYVRVSDGDEELWLGVSHFQAAAGGGVVVAFRRDDLGTHAVPPPDRSDDSQYLDHPLSEEEREQRELVLGQLAEQRQELREDGEATPEAYETVGEPVEQELARMESEDERH